MGDSARCGITTGKTNRNDDIEQSRRGIAALRKQVRGTMQTETENITLRPLGQTGIQISPVGMG
ncbi:MAG: hypothetical protein KDH89_19445, partial [Anaerolineae bacterium]|nr:hypothetical protein [Anaerolineae bacterium]